MKLKSLNEDEYRILQMVVKEFYVALPEILKTYSLFSTHVISKALHHYGIKTRVIPARLWCSNLKTEKEFVGGCLNFEDAEQWNGHAICLVGDWLVDAAIYHLNPTFGYQVPKIIAQRIVYPEPQIYTRYRLNKKTEFVWYRLPANSPTIPLAGYEDFMHRYLPTLIDHIDRLRAAPEKVIIPEQITLVDGSVEDLVEEAMENSAVSNSVPESEGEGEGEGEGFAEEATAERNDELIEDDSPELVADAEVAEEAVAATV
jgi:hypothetical protein